MGFKQIQLFILLMVFCLTSVRRAEALTSTYHPIPKERWSLAEWIIQRDQMRLQDLWLAIHSPSPYEFYVGGNFQSGISAVNYYSAWNLHAAAYASIFGLELQREMNPIHARWIPMLLARVIGRRVQASGLVLQFGAKEEDWQTNQIWNLLGGADLTVYITRFFGVEGLYRHYFETAVGTTTMKVSGDRYEAGAFLDYAFIRVYGNYFKEVVSQPGFTSTSRDGFALGLKVFF